MAPIYKRKTSLGGAVVEPSQTYVQPPPPPTDHDVISAAQNLISFEKTAAPPAEKPKPLLRYRDVLNLSQQDVADFFTKTVTGKIKVLITGDPSVVENEIASLKVRIKKVEELLATRTRMWQKFHRPDDMLPSAELERLKREEKKELKGLQTRVRELQQRLRTWGSHKEDYAGETEEWIDMTFAEKHPNIILSETTPVFGWVPFVVQKKVRNAHGGFDVVDVTEVSAGGLHDEIDARYCIENYRKLISLGVNAIELTTDGMTWENWTRWENAAICVAITEGLVKPDMEIVSRHPGLNRWVIVPDDENDHEEERKQILATGGGSLGCARIYARGWRYGKRSGKWTQRGLESFDATARYRDPSDAAREGYSDAGPSLYNVHDDAGSYDPR